jgi:hypothetical protein
MNHKSDHTLPQVFGHVLKYNKLQKKKKLFYVFTKIIKLTMLHTKKFGSNQLHTKFYTIFFQINYTHTFWNPWWTPLLHRAGKLFPSNNRRNMALQFFPHNNARYMLAGHYGYFGKYLHFLLCHCKALCLL